MKNKYYTPDLEDLFVGYELYLQNIENSFWGQYEIKESDNFLDFKEELKNITLKTKYLTKEQIENEGFVETFIKFRNTNKENYVLGFSKKVEDFILFIHLDTKYNTLKIIKEFRFLIDDLEETSENILFSGKVKSINEFRKVIKMVM